ncbi:sigma-70 family RNA polymerase sigma factor, partial [Mumia xiangluensis]
MDDQTADPTVPSDAELISAVRAGDNDAYGVLFERHRDAAQRMARQLVHGPDADDLVSEAFIKVMDQLRAGAGPDVAFRAYLLTAIRRLHVDRVRAQRRTQPTDDLERYDSGVEFDDTAVAKFENSAAAQAFASLPERWQLVLWHLDVEGAKPADIAPMLGMTANGVSALAYRAREGLRQAYLQVHLADTAEEECRWTTEHLGAYVRQGLGRRDTVKVREHLDGCARCTAVYLELVEVNSGLRGLLAPVLLGAAGLAYLADAGAKTAAGTAAAGSATGW